MDRKELLAQLKELKETTGEWTHNTCEGLQKVRTMVGELDRESGLMYDIWEALDENTTIVDDDYFKDIIQRMLSENYVDVRAFKSLFDDLESCEDFYKLDAYGWVAHYNSDDLESDIDVAIDKVVESLQVDYDNYVEDWKESHDEGEPACFEEWLDVDYEGEE